MANVKVAVRVRPICKREEDAKATVVVNEYQENVLGVANPKIEGIEGSSDHRDRIKHFSFDYCYFSLDKTAPNYASQQTIFSDLGSEILDSSFDGYNVCLFAYGQTGSGKTHTMMGGDEAEQGVIPRLCESLLERVSSYEEDVTFKVEVSFLEIYNERVRDLLAPPNKAKYSLKVREHPKDGPYVQDLSHHLVSDYEQVLSLMHDGNLQRTTAATHMHELSSRSHAIFTITFIQAKMSHGMPSEIVSKINLVDLAGSERASINSSKDRLQEGANINKSLVTLGNCIQALGPQTDLSKSLPETWLTARQKKRAAASSLTAASMESLSMSEDWDALSGPRRRTNYVPYRNSILTWLLKDSLGGNSKTIMIATISPASIHYNETMSTLRYARRAKHIINQPIVNEDRNVRLIRELRDEIDRLRMLLNSASLASSQASLIQDQNICRMLQENEQRVDQLTEAWVEKWSNAARIMQECNVGIRKESVGVIVESELPHLIGMDDDLLSTGIILYHLKEGRTKIGRANSDIHQDIVLYGPDVEDEHAVIINADGHVILTPLRNSKCAVNGINVHRPIEITQGAVILLGSTNMFRFNHPAEAVKLRERRASNIPGRGLRRALSAEFGKRISLSMSLDGSWSAEPESNLKKTPMRSSFSDLSSDISPIMMFNPGLELERVHRLEAEKLEDTRKQLAELEARRAEAEAASKEQESMMKRSLCEHQDRIREQKELIERLKMEHQGAMALAQEELTMMKGKINSQKEMGKHKLEGELTQLKEVPSYHSDLCTIPSVVADVCSDTRDLSGLDIAKKRVALMELLQKQSQRKALAALERRQATLEVQERTAQLILKHEEQKLQDFETDPRLLEGEFGSEQSPEKELGDRDIENTVDSSTENVSTELPASGRVSPVGNSDPETMHHNNVPSPKKETKRIQKQENKVKTMDQKKDQTNSSKKNSRKTDARPTRKVELGPSKTKPREEQIKRESDGLSASPSRSPSPPKSSRSSSPSKSSRSNSPTKSLRSDSPTKSSRSNSPTKSLRSDSPTKSSRSASPTKSVRSESPTKSSRSSSPASTSSRQSRQTSGNVFSRLYPQQETKFNFLRKKSPPRYGEYDPHRERDRDSPHLIRRELSPVEHDPIKLKDKKREHVQDHKHVRTSSVPSSNLPDRTKQNLHSRSRSASPCVNNPVKPATRPKKSPVSQSSQETEKAVRRTKVKSKDTASAPLDRTQTDPGNEKQNNKCQTKTKQAQRTSPSESTHSSPTKRKLNKPENTSNAKTPKGSSASPRSRPIIGKAVDRSPSPRKKSEQTPSHRKTVKRPLSRSRNDKDGENTNSPSPRRKFARTPVVKPKNWPSIENLPKSTPKSEAFYVPLTSEQLRLALQKHASEQDSGPHLEGADLGASGCEQHWSPSRKRSIGKQPQQTQTDPIQASIGGEIFGLEMDGVNNLENEEDHYSSSESLVDSLEEDLKHDQEVELEYDDGPRVVDMTSADEDEFWAIPVSSEDILTASSDAGEDDDEDDIALNLDVHDRKQSSDTLESLNSNDELEADDPCHTTMVEVENTEAFGNEEEGNADPEVDSCSRLPSNKERLVSDDSIGSAQFPDAPVVCDHEEAKPCGDNISCDMEHAEDEQVPLGMQTQDDMNEQASILDKSELDENQDRPTETHLPDKDMVSLEPSHLNVKFEQETVGPTDQEAEAREKDKDEQVSEGEHVETEKETLHGDINDRNATLPQGPQINEIHSMPDLPHECDTEISKLLHEDDSCVVPEGYEQKFTEEDPPHEIANMNDQESPRDLHSVGVLSVAELPDEYIVSDSADPDVTSDSHLVRPADAEIEACEEHGDNKMAEIKLENAEQYPDIDMDDTEQHVSGDLRDKDLSSESSHSGATSDDDLDGPSRATETAEEEDNDDNLENLEENLLKTREEDIQMNDLTDDLNQEPHINEIQSSTDLLDKEPISSDPLHSDGTCENETHGQTGEIEASDNDGIDDPERLKVTVDDFQIGNSDGSDPLLQEALLESPSATYLSLEPASSSDSSHPEVSCEKKVQRPTVKFEMGRTDESGMVPEGKEQRDMECVPQVDICERDDIPQEPHSYKIQSETDNLSGDTPSPASSHPDVTCDRELDGPSESDIKVLQKDGGDGVPGRNGLQTTENDHLIDIKDISDQLLQEEPHMNGICSMSDLPDEYVPPESFSPGMMDFTCDKQTDEKSSNAHSIGFIGKSDNIPDSKTDEELPKSDNYLDEHPGLSNLGALPESHPGVSTPEQFASSDLEPSSVCDDGLCTSLNVKGEEHSDERLIPIRPVESPENEIDTEANGNVYGDINDQPQVKGVCIEENLRDDTVSTEKETAQSAVTMPTTPCPFENDNELIPDIAGQVPNDSDELDVNTCMSENDAEDSQQSDTGEHPEATTISSDPLHSDVTCENEADGQTGEMEASDNDGIDDPERLKVTKDDFQMGTSDARDPLLQDAEDSQQSDMDDHPEATTIVDSLSIRTVCIDDASPEEDIDELVQDGDPILPKSVVPDNSTASQNPEVNNGTTLLRKQDQDEVNGDEQLPVPLIVVQNDADEVSTVSCTVMANQLSQLQRPMVVNLTKIEQDSSDSDEVSSDQLSDDQSEYSEEEIEISQESPLDEECLSHEDVPSSNASNGTDFPENKDQQRPVGNIKDTKEMIPEQDRIPSDAGPHDKLKEHGKEDLSSATTDIPKMKSLPDQSFNQNIFLEANKPLHSDNGVLVMPLADDTTMDGTNKKAIKQSLPQDIDHPTIQSMTDSEGQKIVNGPSDTNNLPNIDKSPTNQHLHRLPVLHGNGESKGISNNHNFRITRASPVPFSDEEMESMESPSSCSSTSAAEYLFDEEQTLSDFLEDVDEVDDEEAAMSDDMSALRNSEVNGEIIEGSQDNGTDDSFGESETGSGIPEAIRKGTVPSVQASLPPNVYKSIFNADSPRKQNILTNSVADSTLPDESALYQSAIDTSLYQTAVESPSAFSNKNEIIPLKKTWDKDQIVLCSTPTGTPKGTPVTKSSENLDKKDYGSPVVDQHGGSPTEHKCRVPPQLGASPSSIMARKMPVSTDITRDLHGYVDTRDASTKNEDAPPADRSVCIGDISTDTKPAPTNFYPDVTGHKEDDGNGEEMRGLYYSPRDLPEQSYILHTLETIQEEDSMSEDSESEDTCSTLHSKSPQDSRETSPNIEHMLASSPEDFHHDIPQEVLPTSLNHEKMTFITKVPLDEEISLTQPSEVLKNAEQQAVSEGDLNSQTMEKQTEPDNGILGRNDMKTSTVMSQEGLNSAENSLYNDHLISTASKPHLKEEHQLLSEDSTSIKQENVPTYVDDAGQQDDIVLAATESETSAHQPETSPMHKMAHNDNEVISTTIPPTSERTVKNHTPKNTMTMQESTADDVKSIDKMDDSDSNKEETSEELPKENATSKRKDVFSRLYPKNAPKFDFKRKSAASVIPNERFLGNVSPKIIKKDLKARKSEMSETETDDGISDKNLNEKNIGGELPPMSNSLTDNCEKTSEAGHQMDDMSGMIEVRDNDPAVSSNEDYIPKAILKSEPEMHVDSSSKDHLDDITADVGATNEVDFHGDDGSTNNDTHTLSRDKYTDAHGSQAVENLKPFLGKDYAIASAKLTMFMKMFGLSVESTDSSEGSDSLRMHKDKGLVDRIVGDGVGYDPDTYQCDDSLTNTLSGSPGSVGHKGGETILEDEECENETWTGSDVAVDGDSSVRDLRSRSTTASDIELVSVGDDTVTDSTSAMSLPDIEVDQDLETSLTHPTHLPRMQPEPCITRSMQLAYPREDIALTLSKLNIDAPKASTLTLKEDSTINEPTGFSSSEMGKNHTVNDVHEVLKVDVDGETKPMKSCADMDQNHNIDSLQELKEDVGALASPYGIDEYRLPLSSSMANNKVPVQIQESAMSPFKVPEVKHSDMSPVGTVGVDDAGQSRSVDKHDPSPAEDEGQDLSLEVTRPSSIPHLTPRVTEVIHSSKVQLEENMVSSTQRLKELFVEGDESPIERDSDIHEESIPSTEGHDEAKEREKELPLKYAGVYDSPITYTNDSDNCKPLKRHVSEKITVDIVHLPSQVSLPLLFEKVEENDSNLENTLKGKYESQVEQPHGQSPTHNQHKVEQPICDEDKAMAEQDIPKYQVSENCIRNPVHLPENSLPAMLSKLGESEGPLSHETKRENTCRHEQNYRMDTDPAPSPNKEQLPQGTLGENHNQPDPKEPVLDISTQYNGNADHDQNRLEEPRCVRNKAITTKDLPIVHVSETCTKHPIHLPEQSVPAMLSRIMESEGLLSQQSSEIESMRKDVLRPEQKDKKCVDPQPSISVEAAQQRIQLVHPNRPKPNAAVVDNTQSNRHAHDPVAQKVQPMKVNLKKDQGMNTDDQSILDNNESAHHVTTKKVSSASSDTIDDLRQPGSDIRTQEPHAEQQMHFKINVHEEPILVKVAYPSNDEPVKWHLFTTDSSNDSTLLQSSKDSVVMVTPALDKSTQCQPMDMAKGHSDDNLDLLVPRGTEDRSTSPEEFPDSMHSFKPITPSPRLVIAAGQMERTSTQIEDLNRDSMTKDTVDSDWNGKKHEHPSSKINQSTLLPIETEGTVPKANLHKEAQSDPPLTTSSLQVPPLHAVDGVSPAYSPVLSSRSTDDELAQIFAGARERAPVKHMFTNTSPEIPAAQRSIVNTSTTTDDIINDISNEPVQDVEEIPTTVCAQTSPFEILTEQRSVLDASTATDDSLKLISNNPEKDIDRAYEQTFPCEGPATNASVQTSPCKELDSFKDSERSYQSSATETVVLTQPDVPGSAVDSGVADFVAHGDGNIVQQPTHEECLSENRSVGTSPIVQLDLPQAEHFSSLNIKTSTPSITSFNEQESQANLSSQSNNQECQTDLSPSGLSSPSSTEDSDSGPWRRASEVLDELSENMDTEELELFAVLMHKRRLSEQTVDRVKGLAAKLRKRNQSDELVLLNPDVGSIERLSSNPPSATNAAEEFSSPYGNSPNVIGSELSSPRIPELEDTEKYPDENKYALTLSPLALSETGTREFDFGVNEIDFPAKYNQPLRNHEEELDTAKDLQTLSPVDDEFLTLPGQKGSMSPPMVPALEQIPSPRSGLPFDRKPAPPTKTQSEGPIPITESPATYSKVPLSHVMDTSSRNDWHSMPLQSTWDEPLNRNNNNSSTDYSEDDIGSEEVAADNLNDDPDSIRSRQSPRATLSKFSDVSFDSELDFPVGANDQEDGSRLDKKDVKNQSVHASTHSLDSVLFADSAEPELLALQGDTDDSNANSGSLPVDFNHSTGFVGEDQGEGKDDPKEMENQLNEAESFRIHVPQISPAKLDWILAESEIEPEINYLPLSKHPEKDKIPLPGFKHQSTESPIVIAKQPSDVLMQKPEGKVHPQVAEVEAYPVKFAMDNEQKGTVPSSSLTGPSARSRHAPGYINQIPGSSGQDPGMALPLAGNRHGNLERTGSSLGESSGIYSLASELPHLHQVKTPSGSMDSLINAASTDEERDMQQLQSEYERLLQRRNSSRLDPVDVSRPMNVQQSNSLKGSGNDNKNAQPRSNGIMNGYSSGDSASGSEIDSFVCGHYSQSMDRRDISIELLEAQVMHGIGETDALLRFLDDDLPLEHWTNRKSQTKPKHGEAEHGQPSADKKEITHNPNNTSYKSPGYPLRRSPRSSLRKSPSGPQSSRSSPSPVTPPPLQRVVTPLLRTSPREQSPSPKGHFKPSEHLKFLKRVRENVVKATSNPTSPTPSTPSPRPQLYSVYPSETPLENHRSSSTFSPEKNDMELFLNELREARRMSQSEISKAEEELHPSRRRYSNGDDSVFADAMSGNHACGGDARKHHPASAAQKDGDCSVKQRPQRSDEDLIDQEIASMRAAAAVILPTSATPSAGISPCREGNQSDEEPSEESPSKPYYYEMYDLPSRAEPPSGNDSQSRPRSLFGYSLYKDPPRSHDALTKTYPPTTAPLQGDDSKREVTPLHQSGSVQLQKYTPLKSTGSSRSLSAPPNRRPTPQPSGVYLSTPQHRGVARPHEGGSIGSYRGSPGSQVKISPVKSSLRKRRPHGGKPFQELPTVRESKLVWSRPECHLVAETALQTLVSEMAPCETSFDPSKSQQPDEEGGWRFEGRERDILLLCKTHSPTSPINSYIGIGIIKAPARTVFNYVKNPVCRQIYDPMLKEVKVKKDFGGDLQVVYMVFKTDQCLLQHPRDCLCVIKTLEMDDRFLVVAVSIKHPRIPPKKKTLRAEVLLAGYSIQPLQTESGMEHCRVTHLSQVNLQGDLQPKLINALSSRLPLCVADLRNIIQIGDA
ncbi:uncharacterized protein LOC105436725 isoform X2 [Strongylocentrotus purpuratus]|uniref:Kinesin-like protein KIF16B n=1 Tax=Strongylocentrotus purpuratus TaxID=7668 RepID=A0A7M7PQ70_STRPU|nr:uncharacterized protein LOC105436725 isoform X2 [Strongylocentrotus purpuratus]